MQKGGKSRKNRGNKRGLSTIIVTLIIILISLVAVGIIWVVVRNVIQYGTEGVSFGQFMLNAKILDAGVDDNISNNISLIVKRNAGQGELVGMKFVFSDGKNSEVITEEFSMNELEQRRFTFHLSNLNASNIETISISPILKQEEKQVTGGILDKYNMGKGKKPTTCTPTTNCSYLGYVCGTWGNGTCLGTLNCGSCSGGLTCNSTGGCAASCAPQTCASLGYQCGSGYANGTCLGTLDCGSCSGGQICNASGRCVVQTSWQFDWNVRTDKYGKPAGYFDVTPFPIDETTSTYIINNDEGNHTYYLGTKYYVDGRNGVDSGNCQNFNTPCRTIGYGVSQAGSGNKIVIVRGAHDGWNGVYLESGISFSTHSGINDTNRFIVAGYGQERPILDGTGLGNVFGFTGNSMSYVTIQRLKVQNYQERGLVFSTTTSNPVGTNLIDIWVYNCGANNLNDGNIHFYGDNTYSINNPWIYHTTSEHTYRKCIKVSDHTHDSIIEWSYFNECGYWSGMTVMPDTNQHPYGIDMAADSATSHNLRAIIRYNIVGQALLGNEIRYPENISVHHNEFYDSVKKDFWPSHGGTYSQASSFHVRWMLGTGQIYSNIFRDNNDTTYPWLLTFVSSSLSSGPYNVYNNLFYWNRSKNSASVWIYGYGGLTDSRKINFYNNDFYTNNTGQPILLIDNPESGTGNVFNIQNNIFYQTGSGSCISVGSGTNVVRNNNQYYAPSGSIGVTLGTGEINSNPQWQSIPSGSYNSGEAALTPSSPAVDRGTSLSSIFTSSFNGLTRPQGSAWDMGIYEYA